MDRGYYYFSQQNDDDTFDLFRRHIDGSYVQVIAEDLVSAPRVVAVSENHDVVMATQNGRVHYLKHSDDVADLDIYEGMAGFLVAWDDPTMIMDVGEPLNLSEGSITPVSVQLFFSDAENGVFLATKKYISADSTEPQEYLLRFYDLDTNEETGLIESINYSNPLFSQGAGEILYVFVPPANAGKAALFSIMMSNGTTAWNNRQLIYEHEVGPTIMHMASSGKQMIMFVDLLDNTHRFYQLDAITGEALLFAQEDLDLERIMTPYLVVSVESEVEDSEFITCSINTSETGLDWLVYSRVRSGEMDDLYVIDSGTYGQSCSGRYTIDDDGHMVFYRAYNQDDGSEGMPQVSLFDVYSLDPELLPLAD
ncbi:MAG: hypothetical protein ACD_62C00499G0001 [uncultured bacterium]|nr:MAG: hypothetical protein ACD_62C00499G0001 [uncultured bacterium]